MLCLSPPLHVSVRIYYRLSPSFLFSFLCIHPHSFPSIYLFICFLPSKELLLKLSHQPLNLSIFCHGKKHLNLSLHLFITCHLQLLPFSTSLSLSLLLSICLCVFPITFLRIELLLLVTSVFSANAVPVSQHSAKANFGNSSILQFSIRCSCGVSFGTQCRGLVFSFLDRSHF